MGLKVKWIVGGYICGSGVTGWDIQWAVVELQVGTFNGQ